MFRSGKIVEPVDRGSAEDVRESRGKKKSVDRTVIEMWRAGKKWVCVSRNLLSWELKDRNSTRSP